jgi:hypothetical protein
MIKRTLQTSAMLLVASALVGFFGKLQANETDLDPEIEAELKLLIKKIRQKQFEEDLDWIYRGVYNPYDPMNYSNQERSYQPAGHEYEIYDNQPGVKHD